MTRKRKSYFQAIDGEPYLPTRIGYDQCCDCGLVHKLKYEVIDRYGRAVRGVAIRLTVWREDRATAAARRNFKFEKDE